MRTSTTALGVASLAACLLLSACGGSSSSSVSSGQSASSTQPSGATALAADARSAATGDIPDNQNFLTYSSTTTPRFSMVYPEGWTVKQNANEVTFKDKNNSVRIVLARGTPPTSAAVRAQLTALKRSNPTLTLGTPQAIVLKSGPAMKVTYTTQSAPNPVTGKSVTLMVDRYQLARGGQVVTVDLGTPTGVDNVDAYKKMISSYRWG